MHKEELLENHSASNWDSTIKMENTVKAPHNESALIQEQVQLTVLFLYYLKYCY